MLEKKYDQVYIYGAQLILSVSIFCGLHSFNIEHVNTYLPIIARFTVYKLLINGLNEACFLIYSNYKSKKRINVKKLLLKSKQYIVLLVAAISLLLYNKTKIITEDFLLFFIAYLITQYPEINQGLGIINYGVGMACSFFEGYLVHIIPSDGHKFVGFEENIAAYEARHSIVFPVKKLLIVITKSLFCPPDLKHFNKINKNIPFLEDCPGLQNELHEISWKTCNQHMARTKNTSHLQSNAGRIQNTEICGVGPEPSADSPLITSSFFESLSDVEKSVAGVINRIYRNSAYKIHRPGASVVYVSVECATPLHTLHRVLAKTALYDELANVDRHELRDDFCEMLQSIIRRSPETRGKCELVFFDDEDPTQNLADVLLDKIQELEPDFENIISKKNSNY